MKHCLKQREKIRRKFTFVSTGIDGPWETEDVIIRFHPKNKSLCSKVTIWGDDDFGMEKMNVEEEYFFNFVNMCKKTGFIPAVETLLKMGFVGC